MTERHDLTQLLREIVTAAKEEVDKWPEWKKPTSLRLGERQMTDDPTLTNVSLKAAIDAIRAQAYADGRAAGLEEAAEICDGYATIEGVAQKMRSRHPCRHQAEGRMNNRSRDA